MIAHLANEAEMCPSCGHPMSACRDKTTAGKWQVVEEICQPSVILQAVMDNEAESGKKRRGVMLGTKRSGG